MKIDSAKLEIAMATKQINIVKLAHLSKLSRTTISYIFNGKPCKPETAGKIAQALKVHVSELIESKEVV